MQKAKSVFKTDSFLRAHITIGLVLMLTILSLACSDDDEDNNMQAPESVISKALTLISGTVTESELDNEEGIAAWKVDITTQQGAEVEVYCRQDNNTLLRLDGETGPYDYNIDPGNGLINFSQAKTIGDAESGENIESWRLRAEDKYSNQWVYTLEYPATRVFVSASDGSILDVE